MSTKHPVAPTGPVKPPLSMQELGSVLVKYYDLHEGKYELMVEFQIGMGGVGPPEALTPGAMIGVSKIGLMPSETNSPTTIDAAIINPRAPHKKPTKTVKK